MMRRAACQARGLRTLRAMTDVAGPPAQPTSASPIATPNPRRCTFSARLRLTHNTEFDAVYAARMKKVAGGVLLFTMPNERPHARLGLAVGRGVGNAAVRNRCKRLVREAFRLTQHDLPTAAGGAYDMIVSVRKADIPPLAKLCETLLALARESHREWERRREKAQKREASP